MRPRLLALLLVASAASAQAPPGTTIVVPFAAGGGADFVAQRLVEALPALLGETITLAHRPGADGLAAVDEVARAPADGRTLLLGTTASMVFAPIANGRASFDPVEDFEPIGLIGVVPRIVLVHPSLQATNLDQLIRLARESPGTLPCGTADRLSQHAAQLFERHAGVKLDCIAYPGGAALRDDLVAGKRKVAFESTYLPEVQSGRLRALAIAAPGRMRALPDVPTTSEAGLPGVEATAWFALFAPKGTDPVRVEQLAGVVAATLRQPAFAAAMEARGYLVRPTTMAQMRQFLQRDLANWRRPPPPRPQSAVPNRAAMA